MRDEERRKVAVEKGFPSLLRRTRSRQGRRRTSPPFCCVVVAALLVPAGAALSAPTPDPPPPGEFESPPTSLTPDGLPRPADEAPLAPSPAPPERTTTVLVEETADTPVPQPVEPPVETPQPVAKRVAGERAGSVGRQYGAAKQPARRTPRPPEARTTDVVAFLSSTPDSRPYFLAALSLAVFVLGTATLLAVLARLGSTRREVA
jgi:hypothetical protein